jgi:hypothetical protein
MGPTHTPQLDDDDFVRIASGDHRLFAVIAALEDGRASVRSSSANTSIVGSAAARRGADSTSEHNNDRPKQACR